MAFISYAQNFEDVMLARALSDVKRGVYVDVGAQDPVDGSVTKHFYDCGWRGLNFEPSERYYARLLAERPEDQNLCCAVGAEPGSITFYELEGTGLSTIVEAVTQTFTAPRIERTVPMTTLDTAYTEYGVTTVHFLKIDVEGAEDLVLRGTRFDRVRPWIVVVEATRPNTTEPHYEHWEPLLTERGYRFVYADGLNRFYLSDEQAERTKHFALPPNYFDNFVLAEQVKAENNLAHHIAIIDRMGVELAERTGQVTEQHDEILRLVGLLETSAEREKAGIAHHLGLLAEAAARIEAQHNEILRLVGLLEAATEREKAGIAHYNGLLEEARARHDAQDVEIVHLRAVLGQAAAARDEVLAEIKTLRTETIAAAEVRIEALEAEVKRQGRHIRARDEKISWLAQDRDRFRLRCERLTRSLSWRLTMPLRWGQAHPAEASGPEPVIQDEPAPAVLAEDAAVAVQEVQAPPVWDPTDQPEAAHWILSALPAGASRAP